MLSLCGWIPPFACDELCLRRTSKWLLSYVSAHVARQGDFDPILEPAFMPTRLIDVGSGSEIPILIDQVTFQSPYIALSYMWGKVAFEPTTKETIDVQKKGIAWESLARTFRDAAFVTRHSVLGIFGSMPCVSFRKTRTTGIGRLASQERSIAGQRLLLRLIRQRPGRPLRKATTVLEVRSDSHSHHTNRN